MKILQKYTQGEEYWDSSFRVVEVEVNDCTCSSLQAWSNAELF